MNKTAQNEYPLSATDVFPPKANFGIEGIIVDGIDAPIIVCDVWPYGDGYFWIKVGRLGGKQVDEQQDGIHTNKRAFNASIISQALTNYGFPVERGRFRTHPASPVQSNYILAPDSPRIYTGENLGYIYFVQSVDGGLIKIGFATDPNRRMETFQMGCPVKLRILGLIKGSIKDEQSLHRKFKHLRRRGEWFSPAADLVRFIKTNAKGTPK